MRETYINDIAIFLPNEPIANDEIEDILGKINGNPSRSRRIVLRNNGIKTRYYAIDRATGEFTHNNATLTAVAVRSLMEKTGGALDEIECLCCGTSSPDQVTPGHAHMVHGELGSASCDILNAAGICTSGMASMKYAYMSVASGLVERAVSTGSELLSSFMRAKNFEPEINARIDALEEKPILAFEKDFLRWMLSDAAGAVMITPHKNPDRITLRIDWIEHNSYSGELQTCMYSGAVKKEDGNLKGWREADDPREILEESYFAIKQDTRLLDEHIISIIVERALMSAAGKHNLTADDITWYLPHFSSMYFRDKLANMMKDNNFHIPQERWFTNLVDKGNTGAASIYLIMEELLYSGMLKKGDKLLCMIPESGRFSVTHMLLSVV